ncbi:MAG: flagellar motor protein MotB [FCB group bacterium]|jgi:chemotaxis protein MotB
MAQEQQQKQQRKEEPIIIKKRRAHAEHGAHGGSWKVAYADFVTAMMAFFIVMWIMGQSEQIKKQVVAYFQDPGAFNFISGKRAVPIDLKMQPLSGKGENGQGKDSGKNKSVVLWVGNELQDTIMNRMVRQAQQDSIKAAKHVEDMAKNFEKFMQEQVEKKPELKDIMSSIKVEMTKEGLRIELIESSESLFFEVGSAALKQKAKDILMKLAQEIGRLPNPVDIEGHTDSRQYSSRGAYTNWELSSDRANSARRVLETSGLWDGQVSKVTGYADRKLRNASNPFDVTNRRISILVRQLQTKDFIVNENKTAGN